MSANETIFISIASYCDPLLPFTISNAWATASHPGRLQFGVVDQSLPGQRMQLPNENARRHIRYLHVHPADTRGACWARAVAQTLYEDEDWFFQIDSHMLFEKGWDERLITLARECQRVNPRCIVSSYPNPFEIIDKKPVPKPTTRKVLVHTLAKDAVFSAEHPVLAFHAEPLDQDRPVRGFHLGAGCLFARGDFVKAVPYDPYLYFHGEEQALAARAFTHGWDIFHVCGLPLYHLYNTDPGAKVRPMHWSEEHDEERQQRWWERDRASKSRIQQLLCEGVDLGIHGLGQERTLADYAAFSGIDYTSKTLGERARRGPWALDMDNTCPPAVDDPTNGANMQKLEAKAVFTDIFKSNTWASSESASGPGSTVHATRHVRRELQAMLAEFDIHSILDLPCGDFNWMRQMDLAGISYIGGDVVEELVAQNTSRHGRNNVRFAVMDLIRDDLPKADLVLCRDCLFHFPFEAISLALTNIKRSGARYLLTTSFTWRGMGPNIDIAMGQWRRLNLEMAPLNLPCPLRVLTEGCGVPEAEDKSMLLFDLHDPAWGRAAGLTAVPTSA